MKVLEALGTVLEAAGTQSTWHSSPGGETEKQTDHCVHHTEHKQQKPFWGIRAVTPGDDVTELIQHGGGRAHEAAQDARITK